MSDTNNNQSKPEIQPLVNKVAASGLIVINLSEEFPKPEIQEFDIVQALDRGLLLREAQFREFISSFQWEQYRHNHVAVFCSNQALIQPWAWMLIASKLSEVEATAHFSSPKEAQHQVLISAIERYDYEQYSGKRVMVKGCGESYITGSIYGEFSKHLIPKVKSVMFGEPCSSVPVYKQARK